MSTYDNRALARIVAMALWVALLLPVATVAQEKEKPAPKAPPTTADGKRLFTAVDSLRINNIGAVSLSPDGQWVAHQVSVAQMEEDKEWRRTTHIWIVPAAGGEAVQITRGERSANSPRWSPDGKHLAFLTDREKQGERQVWMLRIAGGEAWQVTTHKGGMSDFRFSPDGKWLLLSATDPLSKEQEQKQKVRDDARITDREFRMSHLWLWDMEKKESKRLTEGGFTTSDARWSPDGARISYVTRPTPRADDGGLSDIWVLNVASGEKRKLVENPGPDANPRWSPDGRWIAYTGNSNPTIGVYQTQLNVIAADGGAPRLLTSSFDLDAGTPNWSPDGRTIYFSSTTRQASEIFAADVAAGSVRQVSRAGGAISITDISADGKTFIGAINTAERPTAIYRADAGLQSITRITDHNAWLNDYALARTEVFKWKSKDGTEIEGVLTYPVGFAAGKRYPTLIVPHGGPTGASTATFDATAQTLAANGYMLLDPNFRGSTGRGEKFAQANKNRWGLEDFEDCMTGADALIARGWADPERLGAFGWSYGGYMTFWMLTQTDRFKAVSPGAGLTNIYSMYSQNDIQRYLRWFYADQSPWDNFDLYWDRSPMKYIRNVKTPVMILHGQNDTRVPIAQAQEFYRALVEMNVPVDFVVYPRAGHGLGEPRHQVDRIRRYVRFFGKYLNQPVATEPAEDP